jgi:hypothetical protein
MNPKLMVINGKTYNSVEELRRMFTNNFGTETAPRFASLPVSQTITPDTSDGWTLALVGLLLVLLCIALGVMGWMGFLR